MGLGNPGVNYKSTRHNAGFECIEILALRSGAFFRKSLFFPFRYAVMKSGNQKIPLIQPLTFMNRSGVVLHRLKKEWKKNLSNLVVICDTLDLPPGMIRIKAKGGSAGHNGLKSVIHHLGTEDFIRVFIGIGRPEGNGNIAEYVLSSPTGDEKGRFFSGIETAASACKEIIQHPLPMIMNKYNSKVL